MKGNASERKKRREGRGDSEYVVGIYGGGGRWEWQGTWARKKKDRCRCRYRIKFLARLSCCTSEKKTVIHRPSAMMRLALR